MQKRFTPVTSAVKYNSLYRGAEQLSHRGSFAQCGTVFVGTDQQWQMYREIASGKCFAPEGLIRFAFVQIISGGDLQQEPLGQIADTFRFMVDKNTGTADSADKSFIFQCFQSKFNGAVTYLEVGRQLQFGRQHTIREFIIAYAFAQGVSDGSGFGFSPF